MESIEQSIKELQQKVASLEKGTEDQLSMVVFSGDLDKLLAALIIATGATAMDMKVKLFFTFWATTALCDKTKKVQKQKNFMSKLFGLVLPKGTSKLKLSKIEHGRALERSMLKYSYEKEK